MGVPPSKAGEHPLNNILKKLTPYEHFHLFIGGDRAYQSLYFTSSTQSGTKQ